MRFLARVTFGAALLCGLAICPARSGEPPTDSIYRLDVPLVDQDGKGRHLADRRGKPLVIGMFYTSCHNVCPLIVDTMLATERALASAGHDGVDVLFVSFDASRDDPIALKRTAESRKLDARRWTLARTGPADVRKLAAVLGIQYRRLDDGEFNHSSALILLDREGRIAARTETIGATDPAFVEAIAATLAQP
ncbi:MAG TPA: SCO family protein [Rhodanobacteraceae bacterium]|nr:SCO family protein [Rhodanobacteraceae bacterium]